MSKVVKFRKLKAFAVIKVKQGGWERLILRDDRLPIYWFKRRAEEVACKNNAYVKEVNIEL